MTERPETSWQQELEAALGPECFPAGHDDLAATLIRRHAPSHLLWRVSALPRTRQVQSLPELLEELDRGTPPVPDGYVPRPF